MNKLDYEEIKNIFNKKIFENSKISLLEKLAENPNRYVGIFRPTKPKTKIIQNITQSHEIKFGDAFEILIRECFEKSGYISQDRIIKVDELTDKKGYVDLDQLFEKDNRIVFIEQKIRDDHDSTKKRGQIDNFEIKINLLIEKYNKDISCYFYFIDDSLTKNKTFYTEKINELSTMYGLDIKLFYGNTIFEKEGIIEIWEEEIISFLTKWRLELPELPEINFDLNFQSTYDEIQNMKPLFFRKILENDILIQEIFPIIFPENKVLKLLLANFKIKSEIKNKQQSIYTNLYKKLNLIVNN